MLPQLVLGHLLQTDLGMKKFPWQQCHFPHRPRGCHHALAFGNINSNCVHIAPPSDWILLIACSISCVTRTHRKTVELPAQIERCERERRLTDSFAGVSVQGDNCQAIYSPHSNSCSFEMEKDTAGCRALIRNFIVGV